MQQFKPQPIIPGGKASLTVRLTQVVSGIVGDPVDLTGITEISTCFPKDDGTDLVVTKTGGAITILGNPILGKLQIALTSAQTALISSTANGVLELALTYTGDPVKIQIKNAYVVETAEC